MIDVVFVIGDGNDEALDAAVQEHEDERESETESLDEQDKDAEGDGGGPARGGVPRREKKAQAEDEGDGYTAERKQRQGEEQQADKNDFGEDGNSAEAVDHQRSEIHFRLAGIAGCAIHRNCLDGQPGAQDGDGKVVPEIRDADQPAGIGAREQAEVAKIDLAAGQQLEEKLVEQDRELEGEFFRSLAAAGYDAEIGVLAGFLQQAIDGAGRVLAIAVHDQDGVGIGIFNGQAQTDSNGALMAEVAAEMDDFNAVESREGSRIAEVGWRSGRRAVVDGADGEVDRKTRGSPIQFAQENGKGIPVVEDRDYHSQSAHRPNLTLEPLKLTSIVKPNRGEGSNAGLKRWLKEYGEYTPGGVRVVLLDGGIGACYFESGERQQMNAMGFDVYAPEFLRPEDEKTLGDAYSVIDQLTPLILANQGTRRMVGIRTPVSFEGAANLAPQQFTLGDYTFDVHFKEPALISTGAKTEAPMPGAHEGLIIQTGADEYLVAGTGMIIAFAAPGTAIAGIDSIREGKFVDGAWVAGRTLNGDDDNQGRYLRMPAGEFTIRWVRLYTYHGPAEKPRDTKGPARAFPSRAFAGD